LYVARGEITVAVDGEGVSPETVDPRALLSVGLAYFEFLRKVSQWRNTPLLMRGLQVIDKCAGVMAYTDDVFTTQFVVDTAHVALTKNAGAKKVRDAAKALRRTLAKLPKGYTASVHSGARAYALGPRTEPVNYFPEETCRVRGKLVAIGGELVCRATFKSPSEPASFSLDVSKDVARTIARHLHEVLELQIKTRRSPHGRIENGELVDWVALPPKGGELDALAEAFATVKQQWSEVKDINKALGRDDD
jgi:hypothetical protein